MLEKEIERYFKARVRDAGGLERKFVSPGHAGVPDRVCGFPNGAFSFVELKRPGGKARPEQVREHNRWKKLGINVHVLSTKEEVDSFIISMSGT